jgi:hypothetical protein
VADAGPDQTVECAGPGGTQVTLDGSGSHPVDAMHTWREGDTIVGTGIKVTVLLSHGTHVITLEVKDSQGRSSTDAASVSVVDTTPPSTSVTATPVVLWPPNHKLVEVAISVAATDGCDAAPVSTILSVASSEPVQGLGANDPSPDWKTEGPLQLWLRAERFGAGLGRVYTIVVQTKDGSGNAKTDVVQVRVPHDQGQ